MSTILSTIIKGGDTLLRILLAARGCATAQVKLGETMSSTDEVAVAKPYRKEGKSSECNAQYKLALFAEIKETRKAIEHIQSVLGGLDWGFDTMSEDVRDLAYADLFRAKRKLEKHLIMLIHKL